MNQQSRKKYYNARIESGRGEQIEAWANASRRSFTAEVLLLIDQGVEWRKEHGNKIPSQQ